MHIWGKTQFASGSFNYSTLNYGASLVAQPVKNPPAVWEAGVQSLGWEDSLEEGTATNFRRKKVFKLLNIRAIFQEQELTMSSTLEIVLTILENFSQCPVNMLRKERWTGKSSSCRLSEAWGVLPLGLPSSSLSLSALVKGFHTTGSQAGGPRAAVAGWGIAGSPDRLVRSPGLRRDRL